MSVETHVSNELAIIRDRAVQAWSNIAKQPELLTNLSEKEIIFTAGGGLVTRFGFVDSEIWQNMRRQAVDNNIDVAGITFDVDDLSRMGDFYRFLKAKGYNFHCIDERLEGDEQHLQHEVHSHCGACAAVGSATGLEGVEDRLLGELEQDAKQQIYSDMPDHVSMAILVDLHGSDVVLGQQREELKKINALPFNVSIPLPLVDAWSQATNGNAERLIDTLVRWNVQIARNIIGGNHNKLQQLAGETVIVVDKRDVDDSPLLSITQQAINQVGHGLMLEIK